MTYDFEILDHTADVGFVARGATLPEAFASAGYALSSIMADLTRAEAREERTVEASDGDLEGLLIAWLSELLYLFDGEGFLPSEFTVGQVTDRVRAVVRGEPFDPEKHPPGMSVKAITYHQVEVSQGDGCELRVILDI